MITRIYATAVSLVIAFGLLAGTAQAQKNKTKTASSVVEVNCDASPPAPTLQDAVDKATGPTKIFIIGTCSSVTITIQDDITLNGDPGGFGDRGGTGTVNGFIYIDGAQRVIIESLTVTEASGDGAGILITNAASATIRNNKIHDNPASGIDVSRGAFANIMENDIKDNGSDGGILLSRAFGSGFANDISGNVGSGVGVTQHSAYRSTFDTISGPVAVSVTRHSYADLRKFDLTGNVKVNFLSELELLSKNGALVVMGKIEVFNLSIVRTDGDVTAFDGVTCDTTSLSDPPSFCP